MIDRKFIGAKTEAVSVEVERGQLRFFCKAIGETNPVFTDEKAAKAAGYRSLPAPPTYAIVLSTGRPQTLALLHRMGVDFRRLLHGEQHFQYFEPICAGDVITVQDEVIDIYDKKGGALEFFVIQTTATNQNDEYVARMRNVSLVRS